jgi:hypothetical protein
MKTLPCECCSREMYHRIFIYVLWIFCTQSYGLDDRGSYPDKGKDGILSLRHRVRPALGSSRPPYPTGTGGKAARA